MYLAEIGMRIRQSRKARGLTQAHLAELAGISRETLNQLERGMARDLGIAKILRVLRAVGLDMVVMEQGAAVATDYVALAASAGSTGFREPLSQEELVRTLITGELPARKSPHFRRLLEDSPPSIVRGLVDQVSAWTKPGKVGKNLIALTKKLDVEPKAEWTKAD